MSKRGITLIITLIGLILLGVTYLVINLSPPINQYKNYVISGKAIVSEDIIGGQPTVIQIYYPYYTSEYLCRGSQVQTSKIEWVDNKTGNFETLFTVPVGLSKVVITTDCSSCESQEINLEKIPDSVELVLGKRKCEKSPEISNDVGKVLEHSRNFLNGIEEDITNKPFNSSEMRSIKEDLREGREAIGNSQRINVYNESILQAYYAEWFSWKAQYKSRLFELKYCLEKINKIFDQYKNDKCYAPEYKSGEDFSSANGTYYSLGGSGLLNDYPYDIKEPERMKEEIRHIYQNLDRISDANMECDNSLSVIGKTFETQKPYCEARKYVDVIDIITAIIVSLYVGILIGKGRNVWKKK